MNQIKILLAIFLLSSAKTLSQVNYDTWEYFNQSQSLQLGKRVKSFTQFAEYDDTLIKNWQINYNKYGLPVSKREYNFDGRLISEDNFSYYVNGKISIIYSYKYGKLCGLTTFKINKDGQLISCSEYDYGYKEHLRIPKTQTLLSYDTNKKLNELIRAYGLVRDTIRFNTEDTVLGSIPANKNTNPSITEIRYLFNYDSIEEKAIHLISDSSTCKDLIYHYKQRKLKSLYKEQSKVYDGIGRLIKLDEKRDTLFLLYNNQDFLAFMKVNFSSFERARANAYFSYKYELRK